MGKVVKLSILVIVLASLCLLSLPLKKPIVNPSDEIAGKFVSNAGHRICAKNLEDAKFQFFESLRNPFKTEIDPIIQNNDASLWSENMSYYSVKLPEKIEYYDHWNILKCSYFSHNKSVDLGENSDKFIIGTYNGLKNKESFDSLIWFLVRTNVIGYRGFNQSFDVYRQEYSEDPAQIIRKDIGIYVSQNDVPPFDSNSYKLIYTFILDKNDGSVYVTKTKY